MPNKQLSITQKNILCKSELSVRKKTAICERIKQKL